MKHFTWIALIALTANLIFSVDVETFSYWIQVMEYGVSSQRSDVIDAIETYEYEEGYYLIEDSLMYDEDADLRGSAAYALINLEVDTEDVWGYALENEEDDDVLRKIIFGIGQLEITGLAPTLYLMLTNIVDESEDYYLPGTAVKTLGLLEYEEAAPYLLDIVTNLAYDSDVRAESASALAIIGTPEQVIQLKNTVLNPGEELAVRMNSAYAMSSSGDPTVLDIILPIIEDEDENNYVRIWALAGLSSIDDPIVLDYLIQFSKSDNSSLRASAIEALGDLGNEDAIDILLFKYEFDPEDDVQTAAKEALLKLGVDVDEEDDDDDSDETDTDTDDNETSVDDTDSDDTSVSSNTSSTDDEDDDILSMDDW